MALGRGAGQPDFNMTVLAIRGSRFQNGVSRIHGKVSSRICGELWPQIDPEDVAEGTDWIQLVDPRSLTVLTGCKVERAAAGALPEERLQFERVGYFVADAADHAPDRPVFNRTATLRDTWAKLQQKDAGG